MKRFDNVRDTYWRLQNWELANPSKKSIKALWIIGIGQPNKKSLKGLFGLSHPPKKVKKGSFGNSHPPKTYTKSNTKLQIYIKWQCKNVNQK